MTTENDKLVKQVVGIVIFFSAAIPALGWFLYVTYRLIQQLLILGEKISFDKGAFCLFGVSLGLIALLIYMIYEAWMKKTPPDNFSTFIVRLAMFGIAAALILPHLVHYPVNSFLKEKNYQVCDAESYRWFNARTIVFTKDGKNCTE